MQRADRLLKKAKHTYGNSDLQPHIAFVMPAEEEEQADKWKARVDLWNGVSGSGAKGSTVASYHETLEEAIQAVEAELEKYDTDKHIPFIVDNICQMED